MYYWCNFNHNQTERKSSMQHRWNSLCYIGQFQWYTSPLGISQSFAHTLVLHVTEKASLHLHEVVLFYSYPGAFDPFICLDPEEFVYPPFQGILCGVCWGRGVGTVKMLSMKSASGNTVSFPLPTPNTSSRHVFLNIEHLSQLKILSTWEDLGEW